MSEPEMIVRVEGRVGRITLNRPAALNALTYDMVLGIDHALIAWADDPDVAMVLIDGAGEKAFCAGGDIQDLYRSGREGDFARGRRFWADEYRMNARIANYSKPYVALMDGFVMGGGVGVSAHGSMRVVTERTRLAMPECMIGLIPDVGGSWLLARAPGHIGEYIGLTGVRLDAADAIYAGFADVHVPVEKLAALKQRLVETATTSVVSEFAEDASGGELEGRQRDIDEVFGVSHLAETLAMLPAADSEWVQQTRHSLDRICPISAACTLDIIRRARDFPTVEKALALEYRFVSRCMDAGNFLEGVRAALIDRDRMPRWRPERLEDVTDDDVASMLAPAVGGDLDISG